MPLIEITHRWDQSVLFSLEATALSAVVEVAVARRVNLCGANLPGINLSIRNLRQAMLAGANLIEANLQGADLREANLYGASLYDADLHRANLAGAYLREVNLRTANLQGANLDGADLSSANLYGADLQDATLRGALLTEAQLEETSMRGVDHLTLARTSIVPAVGAFEGFKKCLHCVIVHLRIPAEASRSNATGRKCRAAYVDVLEVFGAEAGLSLYDKQTVYRAGTRVMCDRWEPNRWIECGGGIHFYLSRLEAEAN